MLKDVDKKLDMECVIKFSKEDKVFHLSKSLNISLPASLDLRDRERAIRVFVPKGAPETYEKIKWFLTPAEEIGSYLVSKVLVEESILNLILSLNKVESTSTLITNVVNGNLEINFRYHHNFNSKITQAVMRRNALNNIGGALQLQTREFQIKPTRGILQIVNDFNRETPLFVLGYEFPTSISRNGVLIAALKKGGVGELSNDLSMENKARVILYGEGAPVTGLTPISKEDQIYETEFDSKVIKMITDLLNYYGTQRYYVLSRIKGDKFQIYVFLKKSDSITHISQTFELSSKTGVEVNLVLSQDYNEAVWDSI